MKKKIWILLLSFLILPVILSLSNSSSTAQVCYSVTPQGETIDLTDMCTQDPEPTLVPADDSVSELEGEIAVQSILDEVNSICAGGRCTEADYKAEIRRLCEQPGRCPDYFLEEIEEWEDQS